MITILVAFVGQTMAYHFMSPYDGTTIQQHTYVSDNANTIVSDSIDECCDIECCESECVCPSNACVSVVFLGSHFMMSALLVISESLLPIDSKATNFIAKTLYRPPIFTS